MKKQVSGGIKVPCDVGNGRVEFHIRPSTDIQPQLRQSCFGPSSLAPYCIGPLLMNAFKKNPKQLSYFCVCVYIGKGRVSGFSCEPYRGLGFLSTTRWN